MDGKQNLHAVHEQAFFKLVRLAIGASSDNDVELDDEGWEAVFGMSRKQTLVAVVLDGVEKLPAERRPSARVLMPWIALVQQIEMNNRRLNRMAVKVCERFGKDGMGCVVLKGQGNAVLYPRPLHRMAGDIDLWVEGRRDAVAAYVRRYCPRSEIVYHHADFPVLKDTEIEVHFTPSWMNDFPTDRGCRNTSGRICRANCFIRWNCLRGRADCRAYARYEPHIYLAAHLSPFVR